MGWKVKPSKPVAVFGALFGVAILVFGVTSMHKFSGFVVLWVVAGVAIIAFNLWAAFSPRGSLYSISRGEDERGGEDS